MVQLGVSFSDHSYSEVIERTVGERLDDAELICGVCTESDEGVWSQLLPGGNNRRIGLSQRHASDRQAAEDPLKGHVQTVVDNKRAPPGDCLACGNQGRVHDSGGGGVASYGVESGFRCHAVHGGACGVGGVVVAVGRDF